MDSVTVVIITHLQESSDAYITLRRVILCLSEELTTGQWEVSGDHAPQSRAMLVAASGRVVIPV